MRNYAILADASCDLNEELQRSCGIEIVPGHLRMPDGRELSMNPGWEYFTREEFYADLKKRPNDYTTSPPNVEEFARAFESCAQRGLDALVITISGGISGAFGFAQQARKQVLEKYPEAQIECIDSQRFGPGHGLMLTYASALRAQGTELTAAAAWLNDNKNRFHQAGWLDDLSFVASKGRLTHPKAFFGTLAGVKPIGEFDYNGLTTVIGKAKGAKQAYAVLMEYIAQTIENPAEQTIFIAQTSRLPQAEAFRDMIRERFHPKEILINDVFPACGINIGPGLMAAYYMGKPISQGLTEERAIIERQLNKGE